MLSRGGAGWFGEAGRSAPLSPGLEQREGDEPVDNNCRADEHPANHAIYPVVVAGDDDDVADEQAEKGDEGDPDLDRAEQQ